MERNQPDLLIVGGGLAGALVAMAMARWQPQLHVELIDRDEQFGGNHIWSFFASDVDADAATLLEPIIAQRWGGYDIAFPARRRTLSTGYVSVTSEELDAELRHCLGDRGRGGVAVADLAPGQVTLVGGGVLAAGAVIDARGPGAEVATYDCGWQKFVGQMLHLDAPHGLSRPVVMDATVDQIDGYRFVYVLPFGPDRLFVEDTYYSDHPELDRDLIAQRIAIYAVDHGWAVSAIEREEVGVLPVVMAGEFAALWPKQDLVARVGARAGAFHPTTGYSLPRAAAAAVRIAKEWPHHDLGAMTRSIAQAGWKSGAFYRLLDTMLFRAAKPTERYRVLQHFYRLPEPLIERFYSGQSTWIDRARVLSGKPPVAIGAAVRALIARG